MIERPPLLNFQKAGWDCFALTSIHTLHLQRSSPLVRFPLLLRFLPHLELNAVKSSIFFGRVKRKPKSWLSFEVEETIKNRRKYLLLPLTKVMKSARLTSQSLAMPHSLPRPRLKKGTRHARLSPTRNPKFVYSII